MERVAGPHHGEDVGEAQQGDDDHQGSGRLVVESLNLPRPGGLELGHHRLHDDHEEERVHHQEREDRQLVEVKVIGMVLYQWAVEQRAY